MPFLKEIVSYINTNLSENGGLASSVFAGKQLYGISTLLPIQPLEGTEYSIPGFLNDQGDAVYVGVDDSYPVIIYHRIISSSYSISDVGGFGDREAMTQEESEGRLVVFGRRDVIKKTDEELADIVVMSIPDVLPPSFISRYNSLGLSFASVATTDVNKDREQAFTEEYGNITPLPLKPEHIFFAVSYQITTLFNKACYAACLNC